MSNLLDPPDSAGTELSAEEREGLRPSYITLRSELNAAEQANIHDAHAWAFSRNRNVLDEAFLRTLHKRMFGQVWSWTGNYRRTDKNIGVESYHIAIDLKLLLDNCRFWIEHETYQPDEIAARFHHRLVSIHCYPNSNGRHARLATDLLLKQLGTEPFSWGGTNLVSSGEVRARYIVALRAADNHDMGPLIAFVRS